MSCPDTDTWASYLRGAIDGDGASELREHLDTCRACAAVVAKASAGDAPVPLSRLAPVFAAPVIAFKEPTQTDVAVTVRPGGDEASTPAVTMVPSGDDD